MTTTDTTKTPKAKGAWKDAADASTAAQTKDIKPKDITRVISVKLSQEEIAKKGGALALKLQEIGQLEESKKADNDSWRDKITKATEESDAMAACIRAGKEERSVKCKVHSIYETGQIRVVQAETGEVVEERAMTYSERQGRLDLDDVDTEANDADAAGVDADAAGVDADDLLDAATNGVPAHDGKPTKGGKKSKGARS